MAKPFSDRFDAAKMHNGTSVLVGLYTDKVVKESSKEIPEEIAERLYNIGNAYKLPWCSQIDIFGDLKLNDMHCKNFLDELNFIESFIEDPLLKKATGEIKEVIAACIAQKGAARFIMSGN